MNYFRVKSMKRNFRSLLISGNYDAVPVAIAGFFVIQALCAYGGIGVTPDSIVYMSTAQNIHDHGVINDFTNMPVMDFPAFYPIFLSGIIFLTGHSIMAAGPVLDGLLFALLIGVCGWMMNRFTAVTRGYKFLLLLFILGSPCLLEVYSMIWSETLYILFSLFFMIGCYQYFQTHRLSWLLFIGIIAGLSCVTRYAGVSIAGLGGLLMLCDGRLRWGWKKLGHIALYSVVSLSFLALNLYRNYQLTETLAGYREKGLTSLSTNIFNFGSVLCDWLPFLGERYGVDSAAGVFFILLITGIFVYRLVKRTGFFSYDTIALSYFVMYTIFILYTATVSRFQTLDSRLLSPLFLPWLWGSTIWIPAAIKRCAVRWRPLAVGLSLVAAGCFLQGEWQTWKENWEGIHYAGIPGYTENTWRDSETMAYVRAHRDSLQRAGTIYSDAFEGLWFLGGGLRAELIPHKDNPEDIRYMMKNDHFTVIWFDDAVNKDLIDIDYIRSRRRLVSELHFEDGAIYFFQDAAPGAPSPPASGSATSD
jgi:hypothetical protein